VRPGLAIDDRHEMATLAAAMRRRGHAPAAGSPPHACDRQHAEHGRRRRQQAAAESASPGLGEPHAPRKRASGNDGGCRPAERGLHSRGPLLRGRRPCHAKLLFGPRRHIFWRERPHQRPRRLSQVSREQNRPRRPRRYGLPLLPRSRRAAARDPRLKRDTASCSRRLPRGAGLPGLRLFGAARQRAPLRRHGGGGGDDDHKLADERRHLGAARARSRARGPWRGVRRRRRLLGRQLCGDGPAVRARRGSATPWPTAGVAVRALVGLAASAARAAVCVARGERCQLHPAAH